MKKIILTILLGLLCLFFTTTAQLSQIKGKVTDLISKIPLQGATVKIEGFGAVVQTDSEGNFSISATHSDGFLIISYTGYKTQKVPFYSKNQLIQIRLEEEKGDLNEVVVIGYGKTTRKLNTGSVSSISAKEIEQQPVTNVLSALSGRMPGVFVQTTNGLPGGNINIQIRGKGSIQAGTNPLYIVDNVPYDGNPVNANLLGDNDISGVTSPLNNLNPADIISITVLKDADATAIYGSRGANGVVLIETKKASGNASRIDLSLQQGISRVSERPRLLNLKQYLELRRAAFANSGESPSSDPQSPFYAPDLTVYSPSEETDWSKYIFGGNAGNTDLQARVSGGNTLTTFSIGGNYHHESTVLPGSNNYQRGGFTFQGQHQSENKKFTASASTQLNHQDNRLSNIFQGLSNLNLPPNFPIYKEDHTLNWDAYANIIATMDAQNKSNTSNNVSNLRLSYNLFEGLTFSISSGYTSTDQQQKLIFPTQSLYPQSQNYTIFGQNTQKSFITEPQLNYQLKVGEHNMTFLAGATYQQRTTTGTLIQASNFQLESLMEDLASAKTIDSRTNTYSQYKYQSAFGRINYNFRDTYVINATFRRDGSSRFGPGNRYGNFGSIGASWIFSNLSFIRKNIPLLSFGKLRGSYGTVGNDQINDYEYLSTYSRPASILYQDIQVIRPSRISNADFRWETTTKTDIGIELAWFDERIFFSGNYYRNASKDQLVRYALPLITGFSAYQANLPAVIENTGWEFVVNAKILNRKEFSWSSSFNLTLPRNKLTSFKNFSTSSYSKAYEIGYDITRIYGARALGIDPSTGSVRYAGEDGSPSENPYTFFTTGKLTPDYYGGVGNTFNFRNISLDIFAQFVRQKAPGGLNGNLGSLPFNTFSTLLDRWSPSNRQPLLPKPSLDYDPYLGNSNLNIFNTSYLRIKNVNLTYTLPNALTNSLKLSKIQLYATVQNLFTLWDSRAAVYDPESAVAGNVPPLKSFVFGLKISI